MQNGREATFESLTLYPSPWFILVLGEGSMPPEERYLIGELAERAGVNRETLRYYERRGLLKPASRTASGYRVYNRESSARLSFIKRAQGFGFSLEEIGDLLTMKPENPRSCQRVTTMLEGKLEELGARIREMKRFHRQLSGYREQCVQALAAGDACPVIVRVTRAAESESEKR